MKLLITGATGFIGSHLLKALAAGGHEVMIVRRKNSVGEFASEVKSFVLADRAANIDTILQEAAPDCVVHLASLFLSSHTKDQIDDLIESNILFPAKLLEAMNNQGIKRFLNTGTSWEHFNGSAGYDPVNLYAATKRGFEDILQFYVNAHEFKVVTLKLFDTYGPGDRRQKLFAILKKAALEQQPIAFSPGEQLLNLLYIDDVVDAYVKAVAYLGKKKTAPHEIFFVGASEAVKLKKVIAVFEQVSGHKLNIEWGKRPYRPREVMKVNTDIRDAKKKLGWEPQTPLEEGIRKMLKAENFS